VEPIGCQPLAGLPIVKPRHLLQGTSHGSVPPHWKSSLMDLSLPVTDEDVDRWRRLLATREGLHVGYSAATNVCVASALLSSGQLSPNAVAVTVLCGTGLNTEPQQRRLPYFDGRRAISACVFMARSFARKPDTGPKARAMRVICSALL
jgi:threonine synthase